MKTPLALIVSGVILFRLTRREQLFQVGNPAGRNPIEKRQYPCLQEFDDMGIGILAALRQLLERVADSS